MRAAIYGGSFNPPHVGHHLAASYVLVTARPRVDEVWFVPTWRHPFEKALAPFEDRFAMCELLAKPFGARARVLDVERRLGGDSVTFRTVERLRDENPDVDLALVVGADLVAETATWYRAADLRRAVPFIVVGRDGRNMPAAPETPRVKMPDVSSTFVRAELASGRGVSDLVPGEVLDYIYRHQLYGSKETPPT